MEDRISTRPGRVLITPEDGSAPFYATLERADDPSVIGTKLNKFTLLTDETAAKLRGKPQTPNEAFSAIAEMIEESGGSGGGGAYYGTCSTSASDSVKIVTLTDAAGFELKAGICVNVKFTNANSSGVSLNVEGAGSKLVMFYGTTQMQTYSWRAGEIVQFVYDGQYWQYLGGMAGVGILGKTKMAASTPSAALISGGSDDYSVSTALLSKMTGRKSGVDENDTNYTTVMMRGSRLAKKGEIVSGTPKNGAITWIYE